MRELRDFLSGTSATFVSPVQHQFSPYAQTAGKAVELLRISQSVLPPNSWRPALVAAYMIVVQIVLSPRRPGSGYCREPDVMRTGAREIEKFG